MTANGIKDGGSRPIRVLIADPHEIFRAGLANIMRGWQLRIEIVREVADGKRAVEEAEQQQPDVVIADVVLPSLNGIDAARRIRCKTDAGILILSSQSDGQTVRDAMRAGAHSFVPKSSPLRDLWSGWEAALSRQCFISPAVASEMLHTGTDNSSAFQLLTAREREVLQLLVEGAATKQIARRLGIGRRTIESHRGQIMKKLDIHSIAELTKYAIHQGITSVRDSSSNR